MKVKPDYKPREKEVMVFLNDQKKSGVVESYAGLGVMLKLEYPALTEKEVFHFLSVWVKADENNRI